MKFKSKFTGKVYSKGDTFKETFLSKDGDLAIDAILDDEVLDMMLDMGYIEAVSEETDEKPSVNEDAKEAVEMFKKYITSMACDYEVTLKQLLCFLSDSYTYAPAAIESLLLKYISLCLEEECHSNDNKEECTLYAIHHGTWQIFSFTKEDKEYFEHLDRFAYFYSEKEAMLALGGLEYWHCLMNDLIAKCESED